MTTYARAKGLESGGSIQKYGVRFTSRFKFSVFDIFRKFYWIHFELHGVKVHIYVYNPRFLDTEVILNLSPWLQVVLLS